MTDAALNRRAPISCTIAQINPVVAALDENLGQIRTIWHAHDDVSDLIVFPELSLTGYSPLDLLNKSSFIDRTMALIERLRDESAGRKAAILIGAPVRSGDGLINAAFLIHGGEIVARIEKNNLPNYGVFDEKRYFVSGTLPHPVSFKGYEIGILICEDMWSAPVSSALRQEGAEILIVMNGSPFAIDKASRRLEQARCRVRETGLPLVYLNQIGAQDDLVYDGGSFVLNAQGDIILSCSSFEEDTQTFSFPFELAALHARPLPEAELMFRAATLGLKDYMRKSGQTKALIGLSGGIDSALAAVIAVEALGADNVHTIMMPSVFTSTESVSDALACANALRCTHEIVPIDSLVESFIALQPETKGLAHENLQSRLRGLILMTRSNMTGAMVVTTGNKSEMATGYATLYGDMCGGYNPLKDIYKTHVYEICAWINETRGAPIPERIITRAPSAELRADQTDQDSLPPYDILDAILFLRIERNLSVSEIIAQGHDPETVKKVARLLKLSEYKRFQSAPGPKISTRAFDRERRYPIASGEDITR